jgi:hypothetical protein
MVTSFLGQGHPERPIARHVRKAIASVEVSQGQDVGWHVVIVSMMSFCAVLILSADGDGRIGS